MGIAKESLKKILDKINQDSKSQAVFITNMAGKDINWDVIFQFNLKNEDKFYVEIKARKCKLVPGEASNPNVIMTGDNEAIIRICDGKGDFTHAISREQITVEAGKVMEVIRLTRAITSALRSK